MVSKTTAGLLRDDGSVESLALGMGYVGDSEDGLDMMQCDWLIKHGEAIATALERGAAAEAAIAAFRVWRINQHSVQGWMGNGRLEVSMLTAMATYDALKEATDG